MNVSIFNSLPKRQNFDWSKLKAFADDKIKVNEKLKFGLGSLEIVVKGENAGYQHFLLFPQCFQNPEISELCGKALTLYSIDIHFNTSTTVSFGKHCGKRRNCPLRAISFFSYVFYSIRKLYLTLTHQQQTALENIEGKEEIVRNEQFLLFPQCFLLNQKIVSPFVNIYDIISFFCY